MLNGQSLYERAMVVKMDKDNSKEGFKLPAGLSGLGPALNQRSGVNNLPGMFLKLLFT